MSSDWPPSPPEGYRLHDPDPGAYWFYDAVRIVWVPLAVVVTIAVVSLTRGFGALVATLIDFVPEEPAAIALYAVWIIGLIGLLVVIHEMLHVLAAYVLGYDVAIQVQVNTHFDWAVSTVTYGDFQSRFETALIALAPLVVFTPFAVAVLALGDDALSIAGAVLLLANTAGAAVDVRTALLMLSLPSGELLRHDGNGRRQYYTLVDS